MAFANHKVSRAYRHADNALAMFEKSHNRLAKANDLLEKAIVEHDGRANEHKARAQAARQAQAQHAKIQQKLNDFLA